MAFDQRLESDYVDLNLGSLLSHTPVIGSLFSLLWQRGHGDNNNDNDDNDGNDNDQSNQQHEVNEHLESSDSVSLPPALVRACSAHSGCEWSTNTSLVTLNEQQQREQDNQQQEQEREQPHKKPQRKTLSWSDEHGTGKHLCEYFAVEDEHDDDHVHQHNYYGGYQMREKEDSATVFHEQSSPTVVIATPPTGPTGPAPVSQPSTTTSTSTEEATSEVIKALSNSMVRSRSVRGSLETSSPSVSSATNTKHAFLPRMGADRKGTERTATTGARGPLRQTHIGNNGGTESPQYGFYINLTPPSPNMYTSAAHHAATSTAHRQSLQPSYNHKSHAANPIFQSLPSQKQQQHATTTRSSFSCREATTTTATSSQPAQQAAQPSRQRHVHFPTAPL